MNVPPTPAEPGQEHLQHPQPGGEAAPGRGKTVTSACERCRRRKIRCDGATPCATCRRFRINCVRIQKMDTHALEQRVRQLEAQIAELTSGLTNAPNQDPTTLGMAQLLAPDLHLITDLGSPGLSIPMHQTLSQMPAESCSSPTDIPRIQVVDYADSLSPVSPVSLPPSPSLHPVPSVRPKPMLDSLNRGLWPASSGAAVSPPRTAYASSNNTIMPYLSPRVTSGLSRSRSSSVSSLSLDYDLASASGDLSISAFTESDLSTSVFETIPNAPEIAATWTATRFEAETLLDKFFDRTQGSRYPLNRSRLFEFLDIIDPQLAISGGHELSCSVPMARFHVYMAMAIALRMEVDGRSTTTQMLYNCYRLALEEARLPSFWKQPLALEASMLVMLFAQFSGQDCP